MWIFVLLAMGFTGPVRTGMLDELGVAIDVRGNVAGRDANYMTSVPGVFRGGRYAPGAIVGGVGYCGSAASAARGVDAYLMGTSKLPA